MKVADIQSFDLGKVLELIHTNPVTNLGKKTRLFYDGFMSGKAPKAFMETVTTVLTFLKPVVIQLLIWLGWKIVDLGIWLVGKLAEAVNRLEEPTLADGDINDGIGDDGGDEDPLANVISFGSHIQVPEECIQDLHYQITPYIHICRMDEVSGVMVDEKVVLDSEVEQKLESKEYTYYSSFIPKHPV